MLKEREMLDLNKWASLLVNYCLEMQPNQTALVSADISAVKLVEEIYKHIIIKGAFPEIDLSTSTFTELYYTYSIDNQLQYVSPILMFQAKHIDSYIVIRSQINTKGLVNIDRGKQTIRANALLKYNEGVAKKPWVLTLFPTEGYSQEAEMSLSDFSNFVSKALYLDKDDPVKAWKELSKAQEKYIDMIKNADNIHIKGDNIDIKFSVKGRLWINSDGKQNMPSGEIYTTPIEDSVNGYFMSSFPNNKYGKEIDKVLLEFKNGEISKIEAGKNEDYLEELLNTDSGAKSLGEFGIGFN